MYEASVPIQVPSKPRSQSWRVFRSHRYGMLGLAMIVVFGAMAMSHPLLMSTVWDRARYDPIVGFDSTYFPHPSAPSLTHPLGTDNYGRDVMSQLLYGARVSFGVGLVAGVVAAAISTLNGALAGYFGGWVDHLLMGLADVMVLLPAPVVLLIFGLLVRMEWPVMGVLYGFLTGAGALAIIVKSHTLTIREKPFVEAAQAVGGGDRHILRNHLLPGLLPLTAVNFFFTVVGAVLTESLLSFFHRTQVDLSWGTMIWIGQETFRAFTIDGQWHAILAPALAIMLFCSAFYMVGRALDDVLNPRLRRR
ncbi:MAG: ABC transporter permease [Anaerolineales bacterium]